MNLITATFCAPLIACSSESPNVLHAVTMEAVVTGWPDPPGSVPHFVSACGVEGVLFIQLGDGLAVEWPPRVSELPKTVVRCRDCHRLTGRKSPRSEIRFKERVA
jgi:hypothetical protein